MKESTPDSFYAVDRRRINSEPLHSETQLPASSGTRIDSLSIFADKPRENLGAILKMNHKLLCMKVENDLIFFKDTINNIFTPFYKQRVDKIGYLDE